MKTVQTWNWWRPTPRNQGPGACRYKTRAWRFLLCENMKATFYMKRTLPHIAWRQLFTARRFLTKTQKLDCFNMSRMVTLKVPPRGFWKFSKNTNRENLIMQRHYIHALYDEEHHKLYIHVKKLP